MDSFTYFCIFSVLISEIVNINIQNPREQRSVGVLFQNVDFVITQVWLVQSMTVIEREVCS